MYVHPHIGGFGIVIIGTDMLIDDGYNWGGLLVICGWLQGFPWASPGFLPPSCWLPLDKWNIIESGVKHRPDFLMIKLTCCTVPKSVLPACFA